MDIQKHLSNQGYPLTSQFYPGITGLAQKLASKYNKQEHVEDFQQVALTVAIAFEEKFDPSRGVTFYSFVKDAVCSTIQKEFGNKHSRTKTYRILTAAIAKFQAENGTYPTLAEISAGTNLSESAIQSIYFDRTTEVPLLDSECGESNDSNYDWVNDHLFVLTDDEALVIDLHIYQESSLQNIAVTMGVSLKQVSNILTSALAKLEKEIGEYK